MHAYSSVALLLWLWFNTTLLYTIIICFSLFSRAVDETEELKKDVEIDESLFQDLGDLDEELDAT